MANACLLAKCVATNRMQAFQRVDVRPNRAQAGSSQTLRAAAADSRRGMLGLLAMVGADLLLQPRAAKAVALDSKFLTETRELASVIEDYIDLDPFDKKRREAFATFRPLSKSWVGAHAKGGSAPGQAAKRMYVAVDAVAGHMAANGAAPLPRGKIAFVKKTLAEVEALLEQGK